MRMLQSSPAQDSLRAMMAGDQFAFQQYTSQNLGASDRSSGGGSWGGSDRVFGIGGDRAQDEALAGLNWQQMLRPGEEGMRGAGGYRPEGGGGGSYMRSGPGGAIDRSAPMQQNAADLAMQLAQFNTAGSGGMNLASMVQSNNFGGAIDSDRADRADLGYAPAGDADAFGGWGEQEAQLQQLSQGVSAPQAPMAPQVPQKPKRGMGWARPVIKMAGGGAAPQQQAVPSGAPRAAMYNFAGVG
jgi:hypothetical protein